LPMAPPPGHNPSRANLLDYYYGLKICPRPVFPFVPPIRDEDGFRDQNCPDTNADCKGQYCIRGNSVEIVECSITTIDIIKGGIFNRFITESRICSRLKSQVSSTNDEFEGGWKISYCEGDGCDCGEFESYWHDINLIFDETEVHSSGYEIKITGFVKIRGSVFVSPCVKK